MSSKERESGSKAGSNSDVDDSESIGAFKRMLGLPLLPESELDKITAAGKAGGEVMGGEETGESGKNKIKEKREEVGKGEQCDNRGDEKEDGTLEKGNKDTVEPVPEFITQADEALKKRLEKERSKKTTRQATGHARSVNNDGAGGDNFVVRSVVHGDDSVGKSGIKLKKGRYHGSGATKGGRESFYEIDIRTLRLHTRGSRAGGLWKFCEVNENIDRSKIEGPRKVNIPKKRRSSVSWVQRKLREVATEWMREHPGVAIAVGGGPGERDVVAWLPNDVVRAYGRVMAQDNHGLRLGASLANAVNILRVREVAEEILERFQDSITPFERLGSAASALQACGAKCELRKVSRNKRTAFNSSGSKWLASRVQGVCVVRLVQANYVDHCVVVDGCRHLIIDSANECPVTLSKKNLKRFAGDSANNARVVDVREVVDQTTRPCK